MVRPSSLTRAAPIIRCFSPVGSIGRPFKLLFQHSIKEVPAVEPVQWRFFLDPTMEVMRTLSPGVTTTDSICGKVKTSIRLPCGYVSLLQKHASLWLYHDDTNQNSGYGSAKEGQLGITSVTQIKKSMTQVNDRSVWCQWQRADREKWMIDSNNIMSLNFWIMLFVQLVVTARQTQT